VYVDDTGSRGGGSMNSKVGTFFLVLVFGGSVVVLGGHELQQRYREKDG